MSQVLARRWQVWRLSFRKKKKQLAIMKNRDRNSLNKRSELMNSCIHKWRSKLGRVKRKWYWVWTGVRGWEGKGGNYSKTGGEISVEAWRRLRTESWDALLGNTLFNWRQRGGKKGLNLREKEESKSILKKGPLACM